MDFGILDGWSQTRSPVESQGQLNKHSSHSKGKILSYFHLNPHSPTQQNKNPPQTVSKAHSPLDTKKVNKGQGKLATRKAKLV